MNSTVLKYSQCRTKGDSFHLRLSLSKTTTLAYIREWILFHILVLLFAWMRHPYTYYPLLIIRQIPYVAMRLFSNSPQMTSKCENNSSGTGGESQVRHWCTYHNFTPSVLITEQTHDNILDYEQSLFRLVRRARRERRDYRLSQRVSRTSRLQDFTLSFFLAVFFCVTYDGLNERETTRSLQYMESLCLI